jgi:membrane-associated protein
MKVDFFTLAGLMVSAAVFGNLAGYWFGKVVGTRLYKRKDSLLFKQRHIELTKHYYVKFGGNLTLVLARFLPVVRTFAPIIAGVIKVDFFRFMLMNVIGAMAWILSLSGIGYFLVQWFPGITDYMGYIFVFLILLTAIPILRMLFSRKKEASKL